MVAVARIGPDHLSYLLWIRPGAGPFSRIRIASTWTILSFSRAAAPRRFAAAFAARRAAARAAAARAFCAPLRTHGSRRFFFFFFFAAAAFSFCFFLSFSAFLRARAPRTPPAAPPLPPRLPPAAPRPRRRRCCRAAAATCRRCRAARAAAAAVPAAAAAPRCRAAPAAPPAAAVRALLYAAPFARAPAHLRTPPCPAWRSVLPACRSAWRFLCFLYPISSYLSRSTSRSQLSTYPDETFLHLPFSFSFSPAHCRSLPCGSDRLISLSDRILPSIGRTSTFGHFASNAPGVRRSTFLIYPFLYLSAGVRPRDAWRSF